ncbi:ATP-binding protein [Oerskovia jenensis]|uniref:histidine kinase n=1 Tax=Oerskovia jenensis TaxID=162169 RepID=A0ABS2LKQ1_9CELL|nr:ATP-binding protein [Oerskovia jenensis]MBM7481011.1 signal transduction histidine kinase/CheY-like chemotaxis protein [Oerskovia jenensis]
MPLLATHLRSDADVLALRRAGREICRQLGLDTQDQVRVATALSEIGRAAVATGTADVVIAVIPGVPQATLRAEITPDVPFVVDGDSSGGGVPAARRLVKGLEVEPTGARVVLTKVLSSTARTDEASLAAVRRSTAAAHVADALDELRVQNSELVRTLEELNQQKEELRRFNEELEETNRGVLAMYDQLSTELEETNTGVVALYAELDERGRELASANEAKTRFLRNVSHELRSPVNSILGLTSLLADSHLDTEQAQQTAYLRESAGTLLQLVDELLDLARAEAGHEDVEPAPVDVAQLLQELHGTTLPLLRPGVTLRTTTTHQAPLVTDRRLATRVLRNLLANAAKFTDEGHIEFTASTDGDHVRFDVQDTGLGIPEEQLDAVFEEFVQVPNRLQPTARGTGLGLPYARRTSQALSGTIRASSRLGAGSTFTVRLPSLSLGGALRDTPPRPADPRARDLGHVLVVDDDRAFASVLVAMLADDAARVSIAHDAPHALALLHDGAADLALLDVRLPGMDGPTLRSTIHDLYPATATVLMSSTPPPLLEDLGGAAFLPKSSISRDHLVATLRRARETS